MASTAPLLAEPHQERHVIPDAEEDFGRRGQRKEGTAAWLLWLMMGYGAVAVPERGDVSWKARLRQVYGVIVGVSLVVSAPLYVIMSVLSATHDTGTNGSGSVDGSGSVSGSAGGDSVPKWGTVAVVLGCRNIKHCVSSLPSVAMSWIAYGAAVVLFMHLRKAFRAARHLTNSANFQSVDQSDLEHENVAASRVVPLQRSAATSSTDSGVELGGIARNTYEVTDAEHVLQYRASTTSAKCSQPRSENGHMLAKKGHLLSHPALGTVTLVTDTTPTRFTVIASVYWLILCVLAISVMRRGLAKGKQASLENGGGDVSPPIAVELLAWWVQTAIASYIALGTLLFTTGCYRLIDSANRLVRDVRAGQLDSVVDLRRRWGALYMRTSTWQKSATTVAVALVLKAFEGLITTVGVVQIVLSDGADIVGQSTVFFLANSMLYSVFVAAMGAVVCAAGAQLTSALHKIPHAVTLRASGVQSPDVAWAHVAVRVYGRGGANVDLVESRAVVDTELGRGEVGGGNGPIDLVSFCAQLDTLASRNKLGFSVLGISFTVTNLRGIVISFVTLSWSLYAAIGRTQ